MSAFRPIFLSIALWVSTTSISNAQVIENQAAAQKTGIVLYQQSAWTTSQQFLRIAAEAGDKKSQYFLGEAIRLSNRYMTEEARNLYVAAAEQGELYAMLRLSSKKDLCNSLDDCGGEGNVDWREQALKIARERADKGDTEAMAVPPL